VAAARVVVAVVVASAAAVSAAVAARAVSASVDQSAVASEGQAWKGCLRRCPEFRARDQPLAIGRAAPVARVHSATGRAVPVVRARRSAIVARVPVVLAARRWATAVRVRVARR
jgi:hypothetical protein